MVSNLEDLDDDCLKLIFSRLEVKEQFNLAKVCQRFEGLLPVCPVNQPHLEVRLQPFASNQWQYVRLGYRQIGANDVTSLLTTYLPIFNSQLRSISLEKCELASEQLDLIVQFCPNLRRLDFGGANSFPVGVDVDSISAQLALLPQLRFLSLCGRNVANTDGLAQAIVSLPDLQELELYSCSNLKLKHSSLTTLKLHQGSWEDNQFDQMCSDCPLLTTFDLEWCGGVEDLAPIAQLSNLTSLKIYATTKNHLTNTTLAQISIGCPQLKSLSLRDDKSKFLSDFSCLQSLQLERVDVRSDGLSDSGVAQLAQIATIKSLRIINWCLTDAALLEVAAKAIQLEEFYFDQVKSHLSPTLAWWQW